MLEGHLGEVIMRLGAATAGGLLLGLDRELRGHEAGVRTHALVALSSAMITVSALLMSEQLVTEGSRPDPLRVVQGLAQAIGFIAAGIIFVKRGDVHNITTAANIWMASAVGIVAGAGQYQLLGVGLVIAMILLTVFHVLKRFVPAEKHDEPN
jgi:putative Mg2+ transporter-C (MgtC) family protein